VLSVKVGAGLALQHLPSSSQCVNARPDPNPEENSFRIMLDDLNELVVQ